MKFAVRPPVPLLLIMIVGASTVSVAQVQAATRIVVDYAGCRMENTGHGWFTVNGYVVSSSVVWYAKVTGRFYDFNGRLLFNASAFTDPAVLSPYYASTFTITVDDRMCDWVATYSLAVELVPDFGS